MRHIETNHGKQIRAAGFSSVEEFVSYVAENYDEENIRVGKRREGTNSPTYLLQVTDKHDNTLFVELSKDGSYWNVNSAGIFRKGYSNKKETVAKTEPQQPNNAVSDGSSLSKDEQGGMSSNEPNGKPTVSVSSADKGNEKYPSNSELGEKNVLADADTDTVKSENLSLRRKDTLESVIAELRQEDLSSGSAVLSDEEYEREAFELVDNNEEGDLYMAAQDVLNGLMGGHGNALSDEYVAWDREHAGQEGFAPLDRIIAEIERREGLSKRLSEKLHKRRRRPTKILPRSRKKQVTTRKVMCRLGLFLTSSLFCAAT